MTFVYKADNKIHKLSTISTVDIPYTTATLAFFKLQTFFHMVGNPAASMATFVFSKC